MRHLAVLIFSFFFSISASHAASSPTALRCLSDFISKYDSLSGYRTIMTKKEYIRSKKGTVERIEVTESEDKKITLRYLDEGHTGIKNNGMIIKYDGTPTLKVQFGHPSGLGFLINGPARLFARKQIPLGAPQAVDGELFTVNRAGFGYLAKALKSKLPQLQSSEIGDITVTKAPCGLRFTPKDVPPRTIKLSPNDAIFDIEQNYSTLSYVIFRANQSLFPNFHDIFERKKAYEIKIPESFIPFTIDIDPRTKLPRRVTLYWNHDVIGDYQFNATEVR